MNAWEVKYRTLLTGIDNGEMIENAEKMARACIQMAETTPHTLEECYWAMAKLMSAMDEKDRMFPIQNAMAIPLWLAEIAYKHYVNLYGNQQSLERLAERGGFEKDELLSLLRLVPRHGPDPDCPNCDGTGGFYSDGRGGICWRWKGTKEWAHV